MHSTINTWIMIRMESEPNCEALLVSGTSHSSTVSHWRGTAWCPKPATRHYLALEISDEALFEVGDRRRADKSRDTFQSELGAASWSSVDVV